MSTISIGKVRPTFRGQWQEGKSYETLDWVLYQGQVFQATKEVPADFAPVAQPEFWANIGLRGEKGEKGDAGVRGPTGLDGTSGAPGVMGPQGAMPSHAWSGSGLKFTNADGSWGSQVDLLGPVGPQGAQGLSGPQGIAGPVGPQGPQGIQGAAGAIPSLSSSVNSASTTVAANSAAVKTAYDTAVTAQGTANAASSAASNAQNTANAANTAAANAQSTANAANTAAANAQSTANAKANLESPVFTGRPSAPTQDLGAADTRIATCSWVKQIVGRSASGAPRPQTAVGVGQWVSLGAVLPSGGSWAFGCSRVVGQEGGVSYGYNGIAAGGTILFPQYMDNDWGMVWPKVTGFAWRIA